MKNVIYTPQKKTLQLTVCDCPISVSFECANPETSIWHYLFSALANSEAPSVHPPVHPVE